ncbi:MAG: glycosyltransferase family 2 protein [Clostridia bacterium]|nr:glycosyltransferase family 2 protein [Clostridia bacterium]
MTKLLTVAIPCYNSAGYMAHAIDSILPAGEDVEILIVNDGSTKDDTARIADDYARRYPTVCRAIHKENGGHGDAVMTGIRNATGLYFKVLDSDDWFDTEAFIRVLDRLRALTEAGDGVDLMLSNFIYDKVGARHKFVTRYTHALPVNQVFGWQETHHFRVGQYIQMHAIIYRTELLRTCGLELPKHTFYVDELYAYVPLAQVERMMYLDENVYHYFIGREDQSVQEDIMISRIDQALRVNRMLVESVTLKDVADRHKRRYLLRYLEIVTTVSSVLLIKSGTPENRKKKRALWAYIHEQQPDVYVVLKRRFLGRLTHLPGRFGRRATIVGYKMSRKIFGFN